MEHHPRFDTPDMDPTSLKPNLAKLANATLSGLWLNSTLKEQIVIGCHNLESSGEGAVHFDRFQKKNTGKYDGVHMYGQTGCTDYTNSVKTILMIALPKLNSAKAPVEVGTAQPNNHNDCPQTNYLRKHYQPTVQTRNRFSPLNQGNF